MQKIDIETYLADDILTKVDIASMLNSLEVRVPLLDHKVAETSFKIPSEYKINKNQKKIILKDAFRGQLPNEILNHKKKGFALPIKSWFRDNLQTYARDILNNSSHISNYLNINSINDVFDEHQKGKRDFSQHIWSILFLEEWLKHLDE